MNQLIKMAQDKYDNAPSDEKHFYRLVIEVLREQDKKGRIKANVITEQMQVKLTGRW